MHVHQKFGDTVYVQAIRRRLLLLRLARSLTRADVVGGDMPGMSPSSIHLIEAETQWIPIPVLLVFAARYRVTLAALLEGWPGWSTGEVPPPERVDLPSASDADAVVRRNLRTGRERAGLSQVAVATALDVHQSTIVRVESGESQLHLGLVAEIARVIGVPIVDLFNTPRSPDATNDHDHGIAGGDLGIERRCGSRVDDGGAIGRPCRGLLLDLGVPDKVSALDYRPDVQTLDELRARLRRRQRLRHL